MDEDLRRQLNEDGMVDEINQYKNEEIPNVHKVTKEPVKNMVIQRPEHPVGMGEEDVDDNTFNTIQI